MALFVINYDLVKRKDYEALWSALVAMGARRCVLSTWFVERATTAVDLRNQLRIYIDDDDRLFVVEVSTWASWNAMESPPSR